MKAVFIGVLAFFIGLNAFAQKQQYKVSIVGFYNLENFYDTLNNPNIDDEEFLPGSVRNYNTAIYKDKVRRLATVISQMGTDINPQGLALLGVAEIENDTVLTDLVHDSLLIKRNLKFVHYNSPDVRGVDVGLIYNPAYFTPLYSRPIFVNLPRGSKDAYYTRDVLYVKGLLASDTIHVMVNHWPSRSGGEKRSMPGRAAAASVDKYIIDSLQNQDAQAKIIVMGDLNDDPISPSVANILQARADMKEVKKGNMFNPWIEMYKRGIGTLAYDDSWGLFDQIMFTQGFVNREQNGFYFLKAYIFNKDYLIQKTGRYKGYSRRTWDGTTYNYGYSDHFPVYTVLVKKID